MVDRNSFSFTIEGDYNDYQIQQLVAERIFALQGNQNELFKLRNVRKVGPRRWVVNLTLNRSARLDLDRRDRQERQQPRPQADGQTFRQRPGSEQRRDPPPIQRVEAAARPGVPAASVVPLEAALPDLLDGAAPPPNPREGEPVFEQLDPSFDAGLAEPLDEDLALAEPLDEDLALAEPLDEDLALAEPPEVAIETTGSGSALVETTRSGSALDEQGELLLDPHDLPEETTAVALAEGNLPPSISEAELLLDPLNIAGESTAAALEEVNLLPPLSEAKAPAAPPVELPVDGVMPGAPEGKAAHPGMPYGDDALLVRPLEQPEGTEEAEPTPTEVTDTTVITPLAESGGEEQATAPPAPPSQSQPAAGPPDAAALTEQLESRPAGLASSDPLNLYEGE